MPRGIDHLVLSVKDLEAAHETFDRLGFTVTPRAEHAFGTANRLVQLRGGFLELLATNKPDDIPPMTDEAFSFAAFHRRFLEHREGLSGLALRSSGAQTDRADYSRYDLPLHAPFHFGRTAIDPDGNPRPVSFDLTFTGDRRIRDAMFFTCHNEHPENFWRDAYQVHPNGALRIASVVFVAPDPADFHEFFFKFTGQHEMRSDSLGVVLDTGAGKIELLTRTAARGLYGVDVEPNPKPRFVALRLAVRDMGRLRAGLSANDVPISEVARRVVVPPDAACGTAIAFSAEAEEGELE